MGGLTGGLRWGLEIYNILTMRCLTKNTGGLRENNKIHVLQKLFKCYFDYHLDVRIVIAPLIVNGRLK